MKYSPYSLALVLIVAAAAETVQAQTNVNWTGGVGNWSNRSAWLNESLNQTGFLPSYQFNEIARIDGNGVVSVTTPLANGEDQGTSTNPGEVRLGTVSGAGELIINSGGSLRVQDAESTDGGLEVGGTGKGILRVLPGGALTIDGTLSGSPGAANLIQIGAPTGAGVATVSVGSAVLGGVTVVHRNTAFNSATTIGMQGSSIYQPVFSGGLAATLQSGGSVSVGGTLRPDFGGVAPTVGSAWNLLEGASVSGSFSNIDTSLAGNLGPGQAFRVSSADVLGGRRAVRLSLQQLAMLNVNRDTGEVSLTNPGSTPVTLDGYSIASAVGTLSAASWNSLQDQGALGGQWRESPATSSRLSELKRSGVGALAGGQTISLGAIFAPNPTSFGAPTEDLAFQYASPEGNFTGAITYTGTKVNDLLLQVDPSSGQARLRNPSNFSVQIDGYTVSSAAGALSPATWTSLDDQNAAGGDWRESPGTATRISELKRAASTTLAPGASYDLGAIHQTALARDLVFQFLSFGQSQPMTGEVVYSALTGGVQADFNNNGVVDAADLGVWKTAFGTGPGANADSDGDSDGNDFLIWQRRLGATSAAAASTAAATAVPEPATAMLVAIGFAMAAGDRRRCCRSVLRMLLG